MVIGRNELGEITSAKPKHRSWHVEAFDKFNSHKMMPDSSKKLTLAFPLYSWNV